MRAGGETLFTRREQEERGGVGRKIAPNDRGKLETLRLAPFLFLLRSAEVFFSFFYAGFLPRAHSPPPSPLPNRSPKVFRLHPPTLLSSTCGFRRRTDFQERNRIGKNVLEPYAHSLTFRKSKAGKFVNSGLGDRGNGASPLGSSCFSLPPISMPRKLNLGGLLPFNSSRSTEKRGFGPFLQ